jgi:hypothetical protein
VAKRLENGEYKADAIVEYPIYFLNKRYEGPDTWRGPMIVIISEISISPQRQHCFVEGRWMQNGDSWTFCET